MRVSGYYVDSSEDNQDILGNKLYTYQDYLNYKSKYVSLRVDTDVIPMRSVVTASEFQRYGIPVKFVACDVSSAVKGKHISICTDNTSPLSKFSKYDLTIHVSSQSYSIYP